MLIFFQRLKVFQGIKIIPSELSFLSGCSRFPGGGRLIFFSGGSLIFFLGGEYTSYDKVLPSIIQDALI